MADMQAVIKALNDKEIFNADGPLENAAMGALFQAWPGVYARSACVRDGKFFCIARRDDIKQLVIIAPQGNTCALSGSTGFEPDTAETVTVDGVEYLVAHCALSHENADALRAAFPFTKPRPCGAETSFGMGDRLGLATPGHLRAAAQFQVFPVLAQQSIREMERTGRTPENVLDDAAWAVFQEGWRRGYGSDADHLKTEADVRATAAAGFTMFTIDPSDHIVNAADTMDVSTLSFELLASFAEGDEENGEIRDQFITSYASKEFNLEDPDTGFKHAFLLQGIPFLRMAVKYLPAVRHAVKLYNLLKDLKGDEPFDYEMSIDETATPTTPEAHLFVITELVKAGVRVQSLAPRFIGEFQKGIDYIGDIEKFREACRMHALIARAMGGYKLSIHSGSDKFSIFPIVGELTRGLFHEKTAGTSYLEAVRVIARRDPSLYREMHAFALERFETDRASYHVTTDLGKIPRLDTLTDAELPALMDAIDPRQLMHITYGSILTKKDEAGGFVFYDRFIKVLRDHEEEHCDTVAAHFVKHCESLGLDRV
jgi:hypothetical protein